MRLSTSIRRFIGRAFQKSRVEVGNDRPYSLSMTHRLDEGKPSPSLTGKSTDTTWTVNDDDSGIREVIDLVGKTRDRSDELPSEALRLWLGAAHHDRTNHTTYEHRKEHQGYTLNPGCVATLAPLTTESSVEDTVRE